MWKVEAPNKEYYGPIGSAEFAGGKAVVRDQGQAEWFARNGYKVTPLADGLPNVSPPTVNETGTAGEEAFTDPGIGRPSEDAAASRGLTDEKRRELFGENVGTLFVPADGSTPMIGASQPTVEFASEEDRQHYEAILARANLRESPIEDRQVVAPGAHEPGGVVTYGDPKDSPAAKEAGSGTQVTSASGGPAKTTRGRKSGGRRKAGNKS